MSTTIKDPGVAIGQVLHLAESFGYVAGFCDGRTFEQRRTQAVLGVTREHLKSPLYAELQERRKYTNDPCRTGCLCSKQIRYRATIVNLERHGSVDHPGGPVPSW